jgi:general nucleoside transport system permease protein
VTILREILATSGTRIFAAIIAGFVIGSLFIFFSAEDFIDGVSAGDAGRAVAGGFGAISDGYAALFRGSILNLRAEGLADTLKPITETIRFAGPLIAAGLGISLGFRVGLFNIGGNGQMMFGILWGTFVSTRMELPFGVHVLVAVLATILGSAMLGALVGYFKARTGAHEVILTIMLNYISIYLFTWFIRTPGLLKDPESGGNPKAEAPLDTARLPQLFPETYSLHAGLFLVIAAVWFYWWLMERSTIGYRFRMVGHNPHAARSAGINVGRTYIAAMFASAALVGVGAAHQTLGLQTGFTQSIHAGIGFDGITVALLGGGNAIGIALAGLLFGAFKAGGPQMQIMGISPEVLGIIQGAIVLFIAAPPLIRAVFRLPALKQTPALDRLRARILREQVPQ